MKNIERLHATIIRLELNNNWYLAAQLRAVLNEMILKIKEETK